LRLGGRRRSRRVRGHRPRTGHPTDRTVRKGGATMTTRLSPKLLGTLLVALALLVAPLTLGGEEYVLRVLTVGATYAIAVYGMNLILGLTGQLSLAHGGFFGIGVYVVGLLTTDYGWTFWPSLLVAVAATAVGGYVAGIVALRTREEYFAIFTMAMGFIIFLVI